MGKASKRERSDPGWKVQEALRALRAAVDPYIWDQGQELFRRGAVEDFQFTAGGTIDVIVLDPRDARKFFVTLERDSEGNVRSRCPCPYRLGGHCRHEVVSLEYLRAASEGELTAAQEPSKADAGQAVEAAVASAPDGGPAQGLRAPEGPALYRVFDCGGVSARPDGSLLRVVLHSLGSPRSPHKLGLQLFTGTGWTELRAADIDRWVQRGAAGIHARDALLASIFAAEGSIRREMGSELLARILAAVSGTDALVDKAGEPLGASLVPWSLAVRLVRGAKAGIAVEFTFKSAAGDERALEDVTLIPSVAPWIQLESGAFHPLQAGAPGPGVAEILDEDLSEISGPELDRFLSEGIPVLERLCRGAVEAEPGLIEEVEGVTAARVRLDGHPTRLHGSLEFSYGGDWVRAPSTPEPWTVEKDGKIQRYPPAGQSLARARRELEGLGFRHSAEEGWILEGPQALARALSPRGAPFVRLEVPPRLDALSLIERAPLLAVSVRPVAAGAEALPAKGSAPGGPGERETGPAEGQGAEGRLAWASGAGAGPRAGRGIPWLEVTFKLQDGERELPVDLARLIPEARENPRGIVQLRDGSVLSLGHGAVKALAEMCSGADLAAAAASKGPTAIRVPLFRIGELLEDIPQREVFLDESIRSLAAALKEGAPPEQVPLDPAVEGLLRPYQKEAVRWMGALAGWGLSGILADEMGLGKTLMALAHFFGRSPEAGTESPGGAGAVLVVCPSSLVFNWISECGRFFPGVKAVGLYGEAPAAREELIRQGADLLVTSYALLRRDREALESREFQAVILDEAQHIKNAESQTAQAAFSLRAPERWILTGTPVENHLGELWSLFHFLAPGLLGTSAEFRERFSEPMARGDDEALAKLRGKVGRFLLRRTKAQVLTELPPLIEQVEKVPLSDVQRRVYESFLAAARKEIEALEPEKARFHILAALTRLRQICCDPRLVLDPKEAAALQAEGADLTGGKIDLLRELLEECLEEGHRVLLYSQFTSMLDLVEELLSSLGISRCRLDGSTRDREGEVRRFARDSSIPVFLISLKAGGLGLNLTQADTVILYDPWWNPAAEAQAASRAHRMGQTVPVHVHKLIAAGTVEEKILDLQASKRELAASILSAGEEPLAALSAEELRSLL